jgi:hypothetical protein
VSECNTAPLHPRIIGVPCPAGFVFTCSIAQTSFHTQTAEHIGDDIPARI